MKLGNLIVSLLLSVLHDEHFFNQNFYNFVANYFQVILQTISNYHLGI